jgi:hypothetical protein
VANDPLKANTLSKEINYLKEFIFEAWEECEESKEIVRSIYVFKVNRDGSFRASLVALGVDTFRNHSTHTHADVFLNESISN